MEVTKNNDGENVELSGSIRYVEDCDETTCINIKDAPVETRQDIMYIQPNGGFGWIVVLSGFFCLFILDGVGYSFGILLPYLMNGLNSSPTMTSLGGSVQIGTIYLIGLVAGPLIERHGCRIVGIVGALLSCIGIFLSSFVTNIWIFLATFGIITGCGFGFLNFASIMIVNRYFHSKRGTAQSIMFSGSGFGLMFMSPVLKKLIDIYSWHGALILIAGFCLQLCVGCAMFRPVKLQTGRKMASQTNQRNKVNLLCNKRFLVFAFGVFFNQMAQQIPTTFLGVAASSSGVSKTDVTWMYFIFGLMQLLGRLLPGFIVDQTRITSTCLCSFGMLMCTISCFLFSFCTTFPTLMIFSAVYGFFIAFFSVLNSIMVFDCVGLAGLTRGLSIIIFIRGPAAIGGTPIAGRIFEYTQNYNITMAFAGCLLLLTSIIYVSYPMYQHIARKTSQNKKDNYWKETIL